MHVLDYILTNRTKTIYFYLPLRQTENSEPIYHLMSIVTTIQTNFYLFLRTQMLWFKFLYMLKHLKN